MGRERKRGRYTDPPTKNMGRGGEVTNSKGLTKLTSCMSSLKNSPLDLTLERCKPEFSRRCPLVQTMTLVPPLKTLVGFSALIAPKLEICLGTRLLCRQTGRVHIFFESVSLGRLRGQIL